MDMEHLSPAECVIEYFGGIKATARALKRDKAAVSRWRKVGRVPAKLHIKIIDLSARKLTPNILTLGKTRKARWNP